MIIMTKKLFLLIIICIISFTLKVNAQPYDLGLRISAGPCFPIGQLKDIPSDWSPGQNTFGNAGGASTGFFIGMDVRYNFSETGFYAFLGAQYMHNPLMSEIESAYTTLDVESPHYINVPIYVGAGWASDWDIGFGIWADCGLGVDLFMKTKEGRENDLNGMLQYKKDPMFMLKCGGGVHWMSGIEIGAHYYWLGSHDVIVQTGPSINQGRLKCSMVTLDFAVTIPFHF